MVKWACNLSNLQEVLLFLGKIHRFADVGINLCNTIENTLKALSPVAPPYLKGAELLVSTFDSRLPEKQSSGTLHERVATKGAASNAMSVRSLIPQPYSTQSGLIMDYSSEGSCSSVDAPRFVSLSVFMSGDACTGGNAVAAFNTFCGWLDHRSIIKKFRYGSCRKSKWYFNVLRGINAGSAASFTVCERSDDAVPALKFYASG